MSGEGPFSLILVPSRELADQINGIVNEYIEALERHETIFLLSYVFRERHIKLISTLVMGGTQTNKLSGGVHIVVATPGRLLDLLNKGKISLRHCKLFCLDEGDRMLDGLFAEDIKKVMDYFKGQRQTVLFSATMPDSIKTFGETALVQPCIVNVGRAGAGT